VKEIISNTCFPWEDGFSADERAASADAL